MSAGCFKWVWSGMPDLKNELSYEVSFLHVLKNQKSNNFFQSFQVDVVRHAQSDLKQQV